MKLYIIHHTIGMFPMEKFNIMCYSISFRKALSILLAILAIAVGIMYFPVWFLAGLRIVFHQSGVGIIILALCATIVTGVLLKNR